MFGMNAEQVMGLIRQILPVFGGIAVSLGWLKPATIQTWTDTLMQISGPAMIIGSAIWSLVNKMQSNIVAMAVAIPGVQAIKLESNFAGRALEEATPTLPNVAVNLPSTNPGGISGGTTYKPNVPL